MIFRLLFWIDRGRVVSEVSPMPEIGEIAPSFTLTADDGTEVSLPDFRGKKVVLYFYPKADTPGCTKQACSLRDVYPRIEGEDAVVIGISPDPPAALAKFRKKHNLPFVLLSDPDHAVASVYGAWGEKRMFGKRAHGIVRSHFAIDAEGRLAAFELKVKPEDAAILVLHLIET